jgi:hypothetical protein
MTTVRNDVDELLHSEEIAPIAPTPPSVTPTSPDQKEEEEEMTQEKFNEMMNNWIAE